MLLRENNYAYIDGANLHKGMLDLDWKLDYKKFRIWLKEKFNVANAYIFIGNIPKYGKLYSYLQECGFILIFKEVVYGIDGNAKGNCDADLVLKATQDFYTGKFDKLILVSSDGDYSSLISFLITQDKLRGILSPANKDKCSILLKKTSARIYYVNDQRNNLQLSHKEKAPDRDGTL